MAQMTERMKELFEKVNTAIMATSTKDGMPNAVPIGAKRIIDPQTVLVSDQFFNKTIENIRANPKASLMYWEGHEGYQLKGTVTVETAGSRFDETARWIEGRGKEIGFPLKSKGAVILNIEEIYAIGPGPKAGRKLA
ncbi:MAG: pyridoxamine 5'-phosphate oxidase family protein [Deltaproteobacteria bacterium]|nr:pyridoxamine 5'-phosphate oxidase family protein [Deltaproteobacteria bacterium]